MNHITGDLFTPAILAGAKTVTRRSWDASKARQYRRGDLVWVYDRSPDEGGDRVAIVRLTADPVLESVREMPVSDFEAEGFIFLAELYRQGVGAREPEFSEFYRELRKVVLPRRMRDKTPPAPREPGLDPVDQMRHLVYAWVHRGGWYWVIRFRLAKVLDRRVQVYGYVPGAEFEGAARGEAVDRDLDHAGQRGEGGGGIGADAPSGVVVVADVRSAGADPGRR